MTLGFAPETVETWNLERLRPYAQSAKMHGPDQVATIAASIAEFGWTVQGPPSIPNKFLLDLTEMFSKRALVGAASKVRGVSIGEYQVGNRFRGLESAHGRVNDQPFDSLPRCPTYFKSKNLL